MTNREVALPALLFKGLKKRVMLGFLHPYSRADAEMFIQSEEVGLGIERTERREGVIGVIGINILSPHDPTCYRFGYWLGVDYWGQGYATEASKRFVKHVMQTQQVRRIEASVFDWNPASAKVLEKIGFTCEARLKSRVSRFTDVTDELIYVMFPDSNL